MSINSMTKKPLIIANWKMNPQTLEEAERLLKTVEKGIKRLKNIEVVICPPFVFLNKLRRPEIDLDARIYSGILRHPGLGSQDVFWQKEGAYTGEISVGMLKDLACQYVIVGHSERRTNFIETDEIVNKKLKAVLKERMKPILCVGEEVEKEVQGGLAAVSRGQIENVIIAYEPIWAIGTGEPCPPDEAMTAGLWIRKILFKMFNRNLAKKVRILYGGSVFRQNASEYVKGAGLDGLLIGGASLNATEFINICKNVNS